MTQDTFHVGWNLRRTEPLKITFYVSPEILEDDENVPDELLADLLRHDLVFAIEQHRKRRQETPDSLSVKSDQER